MQKLCREIPRSEIDDIMRVHDKTGDGKLNFAEFKAIFFDGKDLDEEDLLIGHEGAV